MSARGTRSRRSQLIRLAVLAGVAVLAACAKKEAPSAGPPTTERSGVTSLASAPVCSAAQDAEWSYVQDVTLGASARDPIGHTIGKRPARKFVFYNNWYPLDVVKQTVCGDLSRYGFYDGLGKEADWNLFLLPAEQFRPLFEVARARAHAGAPQDCPEGTGLDNCFEAEITPNDGFLENSYFPPKKKPTPPPKRVGNPICAYGPWVSEKLHGFRPEIHPSEVVWWREANGPETEHFFLLVQDASGRYDDDGDYGGPSDPGRPPWAKAPRTPVLRIAFEVPTAGPERVLFAHLVGGKILDQPPSPPAENPLENPLIVAGRPVLKVVEKRPSGADALAVSFDGVCQDQASSRLRGYVQISLKMGADEDAGFAALRVGPNDVPLPQFRMASPRIEASNPQRDPGTGALLVDFERLYRSPEARRAHGDPITGVEIPGARPGERRRIPSTPSAARNVVRIPITAGKDMPVSFGLESGREVPLTLPGLAVAPIVREEKPGAGRSDPAAWSTLIRRSAARAPGASATPPAGLTVTMVPSWSIASDLQYVPLRDGELAAEDDTPVSEQLNAVVRDGTSRELARGDNLFSIVGRPTFAATDVGSGRAVPVMANEPAGPGRIGATVTTDGVRGVKLLVTFPGTPPSHVYRLVATVQLKDVFGHEGVLVEEVWSHVFTSGSPEALADALVSSASAIAGLPAERTASASRLVLSRLPAGAEREPSQQRARLLRLTAEQVAEDGFATPAEFEQIVRVASTMGRSQP